MQEEDESGHPKMIAFLKHFTAYSKESGRGHDAYNISLFDLHDSFLPQYEMAFAEGNASGIMCSYNAETIFVPAPLSANRTFMKVLIDCTINRLYY
jgi:beta-glucosidase-like glycosyl hydrolase